MLDFHTHVWPHEPGTPPPSYDQLARYCDAATAAGISQIAITEHSHRFVRLREEVYSHWDRPETGALGEATARVLDKEGGGDLDAYVEALVDAKRRGLPLLVGLEVDHLPGAGAAMAAVLDEYPFDIRLGSVHWLGPWLFDDFVTPAFKREWATRDVSDIWGEYVEEILALASSGSVDVLAHLDVVKVAGQRPRDIETHEARLAEGLSGLGIAVEVSSAGLRKPAAEIYPSPTLLDRLVAAGLSFTTASDAHVVEHIGFEFDQLREALETRGVTELVTFEARQSSAVPL